MRVLYRTSIVIAATLLAALASGCGAGARPQEPFGVASPSNDPALTAAANTVGPILESRFPDSYAGLELDHSRHLMRVYRKPDPRVDDTVRRSVPNVRVAFGDARFSLAQMRTLANRVWADKDYWRGQDIDIQTVGPSVDGSAVRVGTRRGPADQAALSTRYGAGTVTVDQVTVMPAGG
jgi:hypothetical protein